MVTRPDCGTCELAIEKPAGNCVVKVPCETLPTKVATKFVTAVFLKKNASPGTTVIAESVQVVPPRYVLDVKPPVTGLNLKTWDRNGGLENSAATVFAAPTSGLATSEKPGTIVTFTNPTAFTEYTVWAKEEAALAAINNPAARRAFVFMSLFFLYFVCNLFVAEKRLSVNGFFLRTLP